ncbi:MAG: autotransporter-associated beta strand repeat-containing protein, partial [Prosthecobacter sp.]|nr:autotransporter-associated beta strand repeat-containing protein [Prosthecobacter sp.]
MLSSSRSIAGISFLGGAYGYTFSSTGGALLTIGSAGGINNASTVLQTFSGPLAISASQTWSTVEATGQSLFSGTVDLNANAATSRTLTISGAGTTTFGNIQNSFAGSTGNITINTTGSVIFNGTGSYNGNTRIIAGLLRLDSATALPGGMAATGGTSALLFDGSGTGGGVIGLTTETGDFLRPIGTTSPTSSQVGWASSKTGGFAAFGGNRTVNFGGAAAQVTWSATGGVFGAGLILGHSSSDSTVTVVNPIALNAGIRTIIVNDGSAAVDGIMSGALTGTGSSIIKQGTGTLALTGANTFGSNITTGTNFITVSAGVLQIGNGGTAGSLTSSGTGDIQNDAVLAFNRSNAVTAQYVIKGSGIVRQAGTGTTTLTGVNTYTGGTQVQSGGLLFVSHSALPDTGAVSVSAGAMLAFRVGTTPDTFSAADLDAALAGTLAGGVTFASGALLGIDTTPGDFTFSTTFASQSLGLAKLGPNRLTLTGDANSGGSGIARLSGGVLDVGTISDGLLPTGGLFFSGDAVLQGNGTFTRSFSGSSTAAGSNQITGTNGGFSARGGTLTVNFGGNATPSSITISTGHARFGGNFVFGSATADSRVIVVNPLNLNTLTRTFTVNAGVGGDSAELQGVISSSDATDGIIKAGPGLLILSANNAYTGTTTISNGTLQLGTGGTAGGITSSSAVINNGILVFNRSNATSPTYPISGSGQVWQIGTGVTTLGGVNTYAGGTTIHAGVLTFLNTSARPALGSITVAAGATLGLGVGTSPSFFTAQDLDDLFAGSMSAVTNDTASLVGIDTTAGDFAYSSSIASTPRGLVKLAANTLSLSGTNSYTGLTQVNAGILRLDSAGAIPGGITNTGGQSNISFNGGIIGLTPESGNFTRSLGSGSGQVRWLPSAGGGFAAFGGDRTVNFGGNATPSSVSWFNGGTQGVFGSALILSDSTSDSTVTILNPISLNNSNSNRTITVNNGTAAIDAVLAGV